MAGARPLEHRHDVGEGLVALTFDDGPSVWTEQILDLLAAHDAQATFFVLGAAITDDTRGTVGRIVEQGSEVGNHTFSHPSLPDLDDEAIKDELTRARAVIERASGTEPRCWRPPYFRVDDRVRSAIAPLGLLEIGCSVQPWDWVWDADEIVRFVAARMRPGSIVALHDGRPPDEPADLSSPTRGPTVAAVSAILDQLQRRGLRPVTISKLIAAADARAPGSHRDAGRPQFP
jgi:peptidoglycan-N-acetylglucosamine deacetylase